MKCVRCSMGQGKMENTASYCTESDSSQNTSQIHNFEVDHIHFAFLIIHENALRYVNSI